MRTLVMSDLHLEFETRFRGLTGHVARQGKPKLRPAAQALVEDWERRADTNHPTLGPPLWDVGLIDLVLLPGDIDIGVAAVDYAAEVAEFLRCPVAFTPGNHEFYRQDMQQMLADMRACAASTNGRVHLLDRDRLDLDVDGRKVAVLGATLWTDYEANGDADRAMAVAAAQLSDHGLIRWNSTDRRPMEGDLFRPQHALQLHREARRWLAEEAPRARQDTDVVVVQTHHAPVLEGNAPQYQGGPLSPAFVSDMAAEIEEWAPELWVFGHTHHQLDMMVGRTRMASAQRGYVGVEKDAEHFRPTVLEI